MPLSSTLTAHFFLFMTTLQSHPRRQQVSAEYGTETGRQTAGKAVIITCGEPGATTDFPA